MYDRFTDRARKVMQLANEEAQRFNHEYIGTEHILLGLIKEGSGVAAIVLKNIGIDLQRTRNEVEKILHAGADVVAEGKLPQTPRAKQVIQYAMEEARSLNHDYVGTEHLLLGLIREEEGVASQVFKNLGLAVGAVRQDVLSLLGQHGKVANGSHPAAAMSEETLKLYLKTFLRHLQTNLKGKGLSSELEKQLPRLMKEVIDEIFLKDDGSLK